jgi:hypothetical protein
LRLAKALYKKAMRMNTQSRLINTLENFSNKACISKTSVQY